MGTVFCHHHDEAEVYGNEPVPCPFCGLGAGDDAVLEPRSETNFEDSNEALRHALFDEPSSPGSDSPIHW